MSIVTVVVRRSEEAVRVIEDVLQAAIDVAAGGADHLAQLLLGKVREHLPQALALFSSRQSQIPCYQVTN